ncbi:MAG: PH domain-containing protein, partial [Bacteroidota bacterium]
EKNEREEILFRSNFHPSMFYGGVVFAIYIVATTVAAGTSNAMTFFFVPVSLIWIAMGYFKWTYREYILTNERLAIVSGYYYLRTESIPVDKIEHVTLRQYWSNKWLDTGIVTIFGIGIRTKRMKGLKNAENFRDAIHSQLSVDPEPYFSN